MYQHQLNIEDKYSRKCIRNKVIADIAQDHICFKKMIEAISTYRIKPYYKSKQDRIANLTLSNEEIAIEIMIVTLPIVETSPIQSVCTLLGSRLEHSELLDGIKTAAELLAVCEISKAYTIFHSSDHENGTGTMAIRSEYALEADTQAFINQTKYLPPMVCAPIPWSTNRSGGYLRGSNSLILGHLNHHDDTQVLDVINILQNIGWSLNTVVDYVEKSNKEFESIQSKIQFEQMKLESTKVYEELMEMDNKFFFVWKYDKRGRMYSQGYHCNLQGTEYKKAIINFSEKELIK